MVGRRRRQDPLADLSEREREVLGLIAEGMSTGPSPPGCSYRAHRRNPRHPKLPETPPTRVPRPTSARARRPRVPARLTRPSSGSTPTIRQGSGLHRSMCAAGGQDLGMGSSRTRTVDQGSALHPACTCPTRPERQDDQHRPFNRPPDTDLTSVNAGQLGVEPPPESNRRPHPYHGSRRHRCAEQRFRRSLATVGRQVMCCVGWS